MSGTYTNKRKGLGHKTISQGDATNIAELEYRTEAGLPVVQTLRLAEETPAAIASKRLESIAAIFGE